MSQNSPISIENQGFPSFRADLNASLEALASTNSGATEPTTTYAHQMWYDSTTNLLKMRNADDDAWITLAYFDQTNDEWEVRSAVIQAVDAAGVVIKTDDGTTRLTIADSGAITTQGNLTVGANLDVSSGTIKLDGNYPVGTNNVALGNLALDSGSLSGAANVGIGHSALSANTSGNSNTGIGFAALDANTTGGSNTAVGQDALGANTTGQANTAVGYQALDANTSGNFNTAFGKGSSGSITTASANASFGVNSLFSNTSGIYNTAIGKDTLYANTTASNNTAVGYVALGANTTGQHNTAIGMQAGDSITTGSYNTLVGMSAGENMTTGSYNVVMGRYALSSITANGQSTAIGHTALENATGYRNQGFGYGAGSQITTGSSNTILGAYNGNQGGLDIRTSSNNIVLSDGDGNVRAWVDSSGRYHVNTTTTAIYTNSGSGGGAVLNSAWNAFNGVNDATLYLNRVGNDGAIASIRQDGTEEGTISVSGTTVSYNGGHLARWSRLADDSKDTSIVKGTVMTNLDAMVEWGDEDNEQLNKMAVSSVEGDANVAGVFVNWDEDDDWNDMNVAMTGDMVIRIAQGTTVQRGDLLMSAGDGTAKPQNDDIVRSKTIAKVTSTHVSHTYDDGSYLVPCVLMAC